MARQYTHETNNLKSNRFIAVGAVALALAAGGTSEGREIISDAWSPDKQPVKTMKFENVGPKGATVFEQTGDKVKPRAEIGDAALAYQVQPGDTEFSIAEKLFPDKDPREVAYEMIDPQLPEADRANHIVRPGQVLEFKSD